MYVQVRTIDCKSNIVITVSKKTTVEQFKINISASLNIDPSKQRLFFRGKQLEEGYKIFDYNINLNDVIQLMVKVDSEFTHAAQKEPNNSAEPSCNKVQEVEGGVKSKYFKLGDSVDVLDSSYGAWFEGEIVSIVEDELKGVGSYESDASNNNSEGDGLIYKVKLGNEYVSNRLEHIRPVAKYGYNFDDLKIGDLVLANYNIESPLDRGYWYDFKIECIGKKPGGAKNISGTIYVGKDKIPLKSVKLKFCDEVLRIEKVQPVSEYSTVGEVGPSLSNESCETGQQADPIGTRKSGPHCSHCNDRPEAKCKECGCHVCGLKDDPHKQLLCDECDLAYHLRCLNPPLEAIPMVEDWYCPICKNDENEIVKAGEKLKVSKKKAKMASNISNTSRDWGKGMACVGRTKECTLVPPNHYGPIPGIEVGTSWKFRLQVSESGVHRPHVAGIHGRESDGAYSLVLSGGYEDDIDNGEKFMYTGSGGRDLSGNKRTADQSCDQTLTRMNKALAMNCNAPLNPKGAKASDWKHGKPIRVVRNFKLAKHSKYAPVEGNRYDGIYKVVEYYPQKGKSDFIVWRYVLQRDDPAPAPWTPNGKKHIESLGLTMIYPEGYLAAMAGKEKDTKAKGTKAKGTKKRKQETNSSPPASKRLKLNAYVLDDEIQALIQKDKSNMKLWNMCKEVLSEGKQKFISILSETFMCICCQEVVHEPVTTNCNHNFCRTCLKRAFKAEVYTCPCCRSELGQQFNMQLNKFLAEALVKLLPGYNLGR